MSRSRSYQRSRRDRRDPELDVVRRADLRVWSLEIAAREDEYQEVRDELLRMDYATARHRPERTRGSLRIRRMRLDMNGRRATDVSTRILDESEREATNLRAMLEHQANLNERSLDFSRSITCATCGWSHDPRIACPRVAGK